MVSSFLLGVALGIETTASFLLFLTAAGLALVGSLWRGGRSGGWLLVLLASFCGGAGLSTLSARVEVPPHLPRRLTVEGVVEAVHPSGPGARVLLDVAQADGRPARFRASLFTPFPTTVLPGQRVRVPVRLKPVDEAGNPGEWSSAALADRRGQPFVGGFEARRLVTLSAAPAWRRWLEGQRSMLASRVRTLGAEPDDAALLLTLSAGLRTELSDALEDDFARSGLAHVLSVSGLHVAVLALLLFAALRWLLTRWPTRLFRRLDARRAAAVASVPLVWAYVAFTGAQAPAVRSGVMVTLVLGAVALARRSEGVTALGLAALLMVVAEPWVLADLSVQLSFLSVLALLLLSPVLRQAVPVDRPHPSEASRWRLKVQEAREAVLQTLCASAAVTLASGPLLLATFHRVSLAGLLSNVATLPLSGAVTALTAGGAAFSVADAPGADGVLWLALYACHGLAACARFFAAMPGASAWLPEPRTWELVAWTVGLGALAVARSRLRWVGLLAPVALACVVVRALGAPDPGLSVTFLSVGHGDAIVVSSRGHHALVDGGGVPSGTDTGRRFVRPFLAKHGITALDLAVLSHPHPDHALGLTSTVQAVPAQRLWLPWGCGEGPLVKDLVRAAGAAQVEWVDDASPAYALGAARLEVLGPPRELEALESQNDRSVVLRVVHGEVTFLLTGDVESAAEAWLDAPPATVVKAPHHGSRTSSTAGFVAATRPKHVVFCVGRDNRYGFPHDEVVERYVAVGARCHRTDLDGAVTFTSDGRTVSVEHHLERTRVQARRARLRR